MNSLWKCKDSRDHVTRCISGVTCQGQSAKWAKKHRKDIQWGHCMYKKKEKSQLFISIINVDNLTPHHEAQILCCPALNSSSTFLAAELIRAAWSADRLSPRLHQHLTPVYSQLWTEIWCFHHNLYYLSYTSVSCSSLVWEAAPPAVCLVNQIQMFTEQKTEFWINF